MSVSIIKKVTITCDLCGKTNEERKCNACSFTAWQRMSIDGLEVERDSTIKYRKYEMLSDTKHLCPACAEFILDVMNRKHIWIEVHKTLAG